MNDCVFCFTALEKQGVTMGNVRCMTGILHETTKEMFLVLQQAVE